MWLGERAAIAVVVQAVLAHNVFATQPLADTTIPSMCATRLPDNLRQRNSFHLIVSPLLGKL